MDGSTMALDFDTAREYASLCGSVLALASTFYFWLVRSNRERPQLAIHPIGDLSGSLVSANEDLEIYHRLRPGKNEHCVKYWLHLAIVNNSSLPNAVLGIRVWLKLSDGKWQAMEVQSQSADQDLLPVNVDPLTTSGLKLSLGMLYSGQIENSFAGRAAAAGDALPREIPIRIEISDLASNKFSRVFTDSGNALNRSSPGTQSKAA